MMSNYDSKKKGLPVGQVFVDLNAKTEDDLKVERRAIARKYEIHPSEEPTKFPDFDWRDPQLEGPELTVNFEEPQHGFKPSCTLATSHLWSAMEQREAERHEEERSRWMHDEGEEDQREESMEEARQEEARRETSGGVRHEEHFRHTNNADYVAKKDNKKLP